MDSTQTRAAITKLTGSKVSTYARQDHPYHYDCQADSGGTTVYWFGYASSRAAATLKVMTKLLNKVKGDTA